MQCHDACSRGKEGQGLDPHRVWGVPLLSQVSARRRLRKPTSVATANL